MYQNSSRDENLMYHKRNRWITGIIVIAILVFGTVRALSGQSGVVTAQVDGEKLGVLGTYGTAEFVMLNEIEDYWMAESVDYGACVEGEETENTMSGRYRNDEFGEYILHAYTDSEPCLVIKYSGEKTLVFNLGSERLTKGILEDLEETLKP